MLRGTVHLRRATTNEADELAEITLEGWRAGYRGLLPDDLLAELSLGELKTRARRTLADDAGSETWVAEGEGRILGYVTVGVSRDEAGPAGEEELYALYVRPSAWRRGIGRLLHGRALERLSVRGATSVFLWVFEGNRAGRAFYEAEGWRPASERREGSLGGRGSAIVRYARPVPRP